ncbi:four helix bundle protein [Pedobacter endophyticus]|uniref:Four helix bundle protein n=1 Tax=Pedobacter endophyticus TaxID=2789740 RepID=A0A7S9KZ47_9SPHI|nr:four helix bundle protein [Pedobacter endophyticus]QPH39511.1 four helix bundle protein [Pedobacter endophyticus]
MAKFRFQDLLIWQRAIAVGNKLIDISEKLEELKKYRFAEQLRGAALSVSNNIAEGSGSNSVPEFKRFLNYAHRSVFENANIVLVLNLRSLVSDIDLSVLLEELDVLARMISSFSRSLK